MATIRFYFPRPLWETRDRTLTRTCRYYTASQDRIPDIPDVRDDRKSLRGRHLRALIVF